MNIVPLETADKQEIEFSQEQHAIWKRLYARQLTKIRRYACQDYLDGFDLLGMPAERIPTLMHLNAKITPRTGWKCVRTDVRYTDAVPWYKHFNRKEFLITNYMRSWDELDFTPEPDMFHDIFGHIPFMTLPHYAALEEMFAPPFFRANDKQREEIKRLAWFSTEFGLIEEHGEIKIFGTGLLSSFGEIEHVAQGKTPVMPFTIENVISYEKAIWNYNEVLFVISSIDGLMRELARYLDAI